LNRLTKAFVLLSALAVTVAVATGCGSSNKTSSTSTTTPATSTTNTTSTTAGGAGTTLKLAADPSGALKFDKSTLTAKAGKVTIKMDNPSPVDHAVSISGNGANAAGNTVGKGGVSTASANLKPGTYTFFCPVDGHEQAGMKGTLTVK
jgi:plastocyanin